MHQIALGYEPTNGYARSLYHIFTGIRLPYTVPDLRGATPRDDAQEHMKEIVLYPNPTHDRLMLSFRHSQITDIEIMDQLGNIRLTIKTSKDSEAQLDISQLSAGLYFVVLEGVNEERIIKKFIKL